MAGVGYGRGHARAFLSEEQDIVGHEAEIIGRLTALRGEQHQPSRTDRSPERLEAGMACNGDMIDIVHGGPAYSSIIPLETHGLDKVHSRPQTGTKAQNGADVSSNFWFEKGYAHLGCLAPASGPCKSLPAGNAVVRRCGRVGCIVACACFVKASSHGRHDREHGAHAKSKSDRPPIEEELARRPLPQGPAADPLIFRYFSFTNAPQERRRKPRFFRTASLRPGVRNYVFDGAAAPGC